MAIKERLHKIVDELSDEEAATTLGRLASRRADPLARLLDALDALDEFEQLARRT